MDRSDRQPERAIPGDDVRHAMDHPVFEAIVDDAVPPWRALYVGPTRAGKLIEVVVVERDDGTELAIHASPAYGPVISVEQSDG